MPRLSLAEVVDVISKSGDPKRNNISKIKNKKPYSPQTDFYKPLRSAIVKMHKEGKSSESLSLLLNGLTDKNKISNYPKVLKGYQRWCKGANPIWNSTTSFMYTYLDVEVHVNPEVGVMINGEPYLIKLYFKDEKLSKLYISIVNALMAKTVGPMTSADTKVAVLDVRRAKLHVNSLDQKGIDRYVGMVDAEFAYISATWNHI